MLTRRDEFATQLLLGEIMLEKLKNAVQGQLVWDKGEVNSVKGLHLKVTPSGKKVYLLYYRTRTGQQRRPKIGDYDDITLGEARRRSKIITNKVAVGEDPKERWDELKSEWTIDELFNECWRTHWDKKRFMDSGWAEQVFYYYYRNIKPTFGRLKLSEVTIELCSKWIHSFEEKPIAGNRSLEVLSRMFNMAIKMGKKTQGTNPCEMVDAYVEKKRKRFASEEEIAKIAQILKREVEAYPREVVFLYTLIFTGARPRSIERGRWDQMTYAEKDGKRYGTLTFHGKTTSDSGEEEQVYFPPQALELLEWLPKASDGTLTGVEMPERLWKRIKKEAGCEDLWARDWRRTFATVGLSSGENSEIIGQLQNHKTAETMKGYQLAAPYAKVNTSMSIANKLEELLKGKV